MTQIQAYESMSKEALLEHHLHTLQQHADDMDMLSKELVGKGIRPYSLNLDPLGIRSLTSDAITGAFYFGRLNTDPPPEGHWLEPFWRMGNEVYPGAPSDTQKTGYLQEFLREAERAGITHLNPKRACCNPQCSWEGYTDRLCGSVGPLCPECGETTEPICSCPSGDGSLRWPCPVHPPETDNSTESSYPHLVPLPKDEWIRQCAKRFIDRAHTPENVALEIAESCHSHMEDDYIPPQNAADEEMSCWTD